MATIKELVQKEAESFEKAQRLRKSVQKATDNIKSIHDIAEQRRKPV